MLWPLRPRTAEQTAEAVIVTSTTRMAATAKPVIAACLVRRMPSMH